MSAKTAMFFIRLNLKGILFVFPALLLTLLLFVEIVPAKAESFNNTNVLPRSFSNSPRACSPMEQMNDREDRMVSDMFQKLKLSAAQQSKIRSIVSDARLNNKPLSLKVQQNRSEMLTYLRSKNANLTGAKDRGEKMHEIMGELAKRRIETWFKIRQQLTPKQLEGLNQLKM